MLGLDPAKLIAGKAQASETVLWVDETDGPIQGGMSGSPIVAPDGSAIGLVSTCSGTGDLEQHTETGPTPLLAARLPAWLVKKCEASNA